MSRVVVFGGANLDIKARCRESHIAATSNLGETHFSAGGVGRNIAVNLARLGTETSLISVVGEDAAGDMVLAETKKAGVDVTHVSRAKGRTGTYVAVLDPRGELVTAVNDMAVLEHLDPGVVETCGMLLAEAELVIVDCNLPEETLNAIAAIAASKLIVEPVSVPKAAKLARLQGRYEIFMATPNRDQFGALGGRLAAVAQMKRTGLIRNIVIHQGASGATLLTADGNMHVEAYPRALIADVTGAGDAAVAGLAFGILNGYELVKAVNCGQAAANLKLRSLQSATEGLSREAMLELVEG